MLCEAMSRKVVHPQHTVITVSPLSRLPKLIQDRIPGLTVINFSIPGELYRDSPDYPKLAKLINESAADIILTYPHVLDNLVQHGLCCDSIKWFQSTSAGAEELFHAFPKPPDHMVFTRMGEGFGGFMAEYVLGQIISREHYFPQMAEYQRQKVWSRSKFIQKRSLASLTIGVLGTGAIGIKIAEASKAFGMTVKGLAKTMKESIMPHFDVILQNQDLPKFLAGCDYVCSVLPSTVETKGMLSGDVLKACKEKKTIFINVGRGDVIDEASVFKALNMGWIGGAILDAIDREPLPADSPLWTHPDVVITPHISGPVTTDKIAKVFDSNYKKFLKGEEMDYVVDWQRKY
ncbi:glyoxylate/hydroxypyruvate reductase A-like [Crassostrea angulata]|uniref:glyoxylate/hydroxypyruvate reductase A-like n=1 Tax=Magallana angulata TaxID=2784310 RepID=UPI0022B177FB|nr:glyoxylate/hydroxypyruvate reductase A-like [Crassostrea angulata]